MEETTQNTDLETPAKSGHNPLMLVGVVAIVALGGIAMIIGGNKNANSAATTSPSIEARQVEGATTASAAAETAVNTISVDAGAFYYKPNTITVKKGMKVKIVMTSKDMQHDFIIDELNVKLPITKSGETNSVEFTPDKAGTFEYYCSVGQHRAKGQVGKITVE